MNNYKVDGVLNIQPGNNNSRYFNSKLSDGKKESFKKKADNEFKRLLELEIKKFDSNKK